MVRTEKANETYLAEPEELGFGRCNKCKCSRANPNMGSPLICVKFPNAKLKANSYCAQCERR